MDPAQKEQPFWGDEEMPSTEESQQQKKNYVPPCLEGETTHKPFIMTVPEANWSFGGSLSTQPSYSNTVKKIRDRLREEDKSNSNNNSNNKPQDSQESRKKRTFTIFNLASDQPSETVIMEAVANRFNRKVEDILEVVARDTRFRARYNLLFKHEADCSYLKRNGITIAGQRIKGSNDRPRRPQVIRIFIPNFPVYGLEEELFDLVHEFALINFLRQRRHGKHNVFIGGWVGAITLKPDCTIPDSIHYNDEDFDIIYPGKPRKEKTLQKNNPNVDEEKTSEKNVSKPVVEEKTSEKNSSHSVVEEKTSQKNVSKPVVEEKTSQKNSSHVVVEEKTSQKNTSKTTKTDNKKNVSQDSHSSDNVAFKIDKNNFTSAFKTQLEKSLESKTCLNNKELRKYIDVVNERNSSPPPGYYDDDDMSSHSTVKTKAESVSSAESYVSTRSEGIQGYKYKRARKSARRRVPCKKQEIIPTPPEIFITPKDNDVEDAPPQNLNDNKSKELNDSVD